MSICLYFNHPTQSNEFSIQRIYISRKNVCCTALYKQWIICQIRWKWSSCDPCLELQRGYTQGRNWWKLQESWMSCMCEICRGKGARDIWGLPQQASMSIAYWFCSPDATASAWPSLRMFSRPFNATWTILVSITVKRSHRGLMQPWLTINLRRKQDRGKFLKRTEIFKQFTHNFS